MDSSKLTTKFPNSPWSKRDTPSSIVKDVPSVVERSIKSSPTSVDPSDKKKGKKLHFSLEVVEAPKKPLTRAVAKRFPMEKTPKYLTKVLNTIP